MLKKQSPYHLQNACLNSDGTTLNQCKKATSIVNDLVLGVHNVYDGSADAAFGDLQSEMDQLRTTAGDLGVDSEILH